MVDNAVPNATIAPIEIKNPLGSKTLWFNLFMLLFAVVEMVTPILQPYIPVNVFAGIMAFTSIVNIILRFISTAKLMWSASLVKPPVTQ